MSFAIPQNELALLKESVLRAVLNNQALPGSDRPLHFPDLPFVLSQREIYLVDDDIRTDIHIESLGKPVQLISEATLADRQGASGKVVYFQFHTSEVSEKSLKLRLDAKVQSAGYSRTLSLTSMELKLEKDGDKWQMTNEPTSLSA
jgi:hypothetical protein